MEYYIAAAFKNADGTNKEFSSVSGTTKNLKKAEKLCAKMNKEEGSFRTYVVKSFNSAV